MGVTCEIKKHLGVLSVNKRTNWRAEANIVSWNGQADKLDIRSWSPDHTSRSKGVTLRLDDEGRELAKVLAEYYREG